MCVRALIVQRLSGWLEQATQFIHPIKRKKYQISTKEMRTLIRDFCYRSIMSIHIEIDILDLHKGTINHTIKALATSA